MQKKLVINLAIIALAIGVAAFVSRYNTRAPMIFEDVTNSDITTVFLGGKIYFSATTTDKNLVSGIFAYDFKSKHLENVLQNQRENLDSIPTPAKTSSGISPTIFSPDGKQLLMIKNDGLHLFNIDDPQHPRDAGLIIESVSFGAVMRVSISKNGNLLAVSFPGKHEVLVAKIDSWNPFSVIPLKTIPAKAVATVFSPDGNYIAVQELRSPSRKGEYAVLSAWSLTENSATDILSLYNFNTNSIRLLGWVE